MYIPLFTTVVAVADSRFCAHTGSSLSRPQLITVHHRSSRALVPARRKITTTCVPGVREGGWKRREKDRAHSGYPELDAEEIRSRSIVLARERATDAISSLRAFRNHPTTSCGSRGCGATLSRPRCIIAIIANEVFCRGMSAEERTDECTVV